MFNGKRAEKANPNAISEDKPDHWRNKNTKTKKLPQKSLGFP
jgi:hypothetical protein